MATLSVEGVVAVHFRSVFAVLLAMTSTALGATPSVFVRFQPPTAWWSTPMEARILGTTAGSVTTEQLSKYLDDTMIFSPYSVCSLETIGPETFVGLNRETQEEINATFAHVAWRVEGISPDGRAILGQSVVFESCFEGDLRGAALLVTDKDTGEIFRWEPVGNQVDQYGRSFPSWAVFLSPGEGDELFSYSGCTECGARTYVYYDVSRKHIYTEYNGH